MIRDAAYAFHDLGVLNGDRYWDSTSTQDSACDKEDGCEEQLHLFDDGWYNYSGSVCRFGGYKPWELEKERVLTMLGRGRFLGDGSEFPAFILPAQPREA